MSNRTLNAAQKPERARKNPRIAENPASRAARTKRATPGASSASISPEERRRLIAEAAYFIAERRGFAAGSELEDWLQAEAQIEGRLGSPGTGTPH
ncbi:MAG: DUF2934 domain-containing protein [Betaproteobacteria bacterium]|nr:DUF2934 domain-containing protein [Betaproteobacteria bacterium]MBI3938031.1 DUF2934 domain-containing protein [Betaproteobacteria bacterium]